MIFTPELIFSVPAIWNIQTSVELPEMVTFVGIRRPVVHLYKPGVSVLPPIFPAPRLRKSGLSLPAASLYAACILPTAVVNFWAAVILQGKGPAASTV